MKVGDYVRTNDGLIGKIINFIDEPTDYYFNCYVTDLPDKKWEDKYITEYNNIKISPSIIDLIEVGDIITLDSDDNIYKVGGVPNNEVGLDIFYLDKNYDGETEDISIYPKDMKKHIKSIITKEQFESMEYKVGE